MVAQPTLPRATIVRPHTSNKARVVEPIPPRRVLPAKCSRSFQFENGQRDFLLKNCLKNNGVRVGQLPDRCERLIDVDGRRQLRTGWKAGCLRREGYVLR